MNITRRISYDKEEAIKNKEKAVVNLWLAFRDLSDYGDDAMTEEDLALWGYVTGHSDIQSRLQE